MHPEHRHVFVNGVAVAVLVSVGAGYAANVVKGNPATLAPMFNPGIGIGNMSVTATSMVSFAHDTFVATGDRLRNAKRVDGASTALKTSGKEQPKKRA